MLILANFYLDVNLCLACEGVSFRGSGAEGISAFSSFRRVMSDLFYMSPIHLAQLHEALATPMHQSCFSILDQFIFA